MDGEKREQAEAPFRWQEWLLEGFEGMTETIRAEHLPPEFWQHLGRALCELGTALQLLGVSVPSASGDHLLEAYERLMKKQGYSPPGDDAAHMGDADEF